MVDVRPVDPPGRSRPPNRAPSIFDRAREIMGQLEPQAILAGIIGAVAVILAIALVVYAAARNPNDRSAALTSGDDVATSTTDQAGGTSPANDGANDDGADDDSAIVLPLDLDQVGFLRGAITPTLAGEGPAATGFCNNAPNTQGLQEWIGDRITEEGGRRRVAQLVARFQSSADAAAFLFSNGDIIDCDSWQTESGDERLTFTVSEATPETVLGDETRRFELTATGDEIALFLRILLVRSGAEVAQFTLVSGNQEDLPLIDRLADEATAELGY